MALENLFAYAVALGLPLWLVVEEIRHRVAPRREAEAAAVAAAQSEAPAPAPAFKRRAPEGASPRAHVSAV
jgi:hypothetical protein